MASQRRTAAAQSDELAPRRAKRPPATTPSARENQLIAKAYDLVEQRIDDGTATSQEVTHFLKMGSSREYLEQQKVQADIELNRKKMETMASAARVEELMETAISAFRSYSPSGGPTETFDD